MLCPQVVRILCTLPDKDQLLDNMIKYHVDMMKIDVNTSFHLKRVAVLKNICSTLLGEIPRASIVQDEVSNPVFSEDTVFDSEERDNPSPARKKKGRHKVKVSRDNPSPARKKEGRHKVKVSRDTDGNRINADDSGDSLANRVRGGTLPQSVNELLLREIAELRGENVELRARLALENAGAKTCQEIP
jgi:hypothetical protein